MPIRGLRVQKYTSNMAMFGDFHQTEQMFLHPTTNTCYKSVRTDSIHHSGCVIDKQISLSMVKWV